MIEIPTTLQTIFATVAAVLFVGGAIPTAALFLFKAYSEKWLNAKFEQKLASYKHLQNKEIEEFRYSINATLDRRIKLHQKEFECIPEIWNLLVHAYSHAISATSAYQEYPDINRMNQEQFLEFISQSKLPEWRKTELSNAKDKTKYYIKAISWNKISDASNARSAFKTNLAINGIFLEKNIKKQFIDIENLISEAIYEHGLNLEEIKTTNIEREKINCLQKNGAALMQDIENSIIKRLWHSNITESE